MKQNKVAFILDSNLAYLDNQVNDLVKQWGYKTSQLEEVEQWAKGLAHQDGLFNIEKIIHLNLRKPENLKKFNLFLKENKMTSDWFGSGVIITATDARGAKKIEELVTSSNGYFVKKRKPEEVSKDLLSELHIKNNIKQQLLLFAGQDYDLLLGLVKTLKSKTEQEQKNLTLEQVFLQLPFKAGEVPPWEFINPMFESNTSLALEKLTRSMNRSHALVSMTFLVREVDKLYKYVILNTSNISDKSKLEYLGLKNQYGLISINKLRKKPSIATAEYLVNLVYDAESSFKTGKVYNEELYMRNLVTKIILALKLDKPLERIT